MLHGFWVVEDVAGFGVDGQFVVGEVGDVGELQHGYADVGYGDRGIQLFAAADAVDEVEEVSIGHGVAAYGVGTGGLGARLELVGLLAVPVVELVAVAVDEDGTLGA